MTLEPYDPATPVRSWRKAHERSMVTHGAELTVGCIVMALLTLGTMFDGVLPVVGSWDDQFRLPGVIVTTFLVLLTIGRVRKYR